MKNILAAATLALVSCASPSRDIIEGGVAGQVPPDHPALLAVDRERAETEALLKLFPIQPSPISNETGSHQKP